MIDFRELRRKGTAVYLVVSEGAAEIYKEFIATFLGQAVLEMRLDGVNEPETPCFVLIDEAYQLNVSEVKRISGIGRGRGVGLGLGYQDLPQMYDQYGKEQANAILGTVMTKIFLPGLDDVTAEYASKQLGDTTIYAKTFQDFPGKKSDNIRYAEQKRSLMHAGEVRQIAAHNELLVVNDTAPPIKAAYPPLAVLKQKFAARSYGKPRAFYLGDVDADFRFAESKTATAVAVSTTKQTDSAEAEKVEQLSNAVFESVSEVITKDAIFSDDTKTPMNFDTPLSDGEDVASRINESSVTRGDSSEIENPAAAATVTMSKTIETEVDSTTDENNSGTISNALNSLSDEVRRASQEIYNHKLSEMNRTVI
jgi:hypothetical protein